MRCLLNYFYFLTFCWTDKERGVSTVRPCGDKKPNWSCCIHQLREHEQWYQRSHQEQKASTCAAGAIAEVPLTAGHFSTDSCFYLCILCTHLRRGAALRDLGLTSGSHWENGNNVSVWASLCETEWDVWNRTPFTCFCDAAVLIPCAVKS